MLYTYDYSTEYIPSMPVVEIKIGRARTVPEFSINAIMDSGADATMIPAAYLQQINARKGKQTIVRSYLGKRGLVDRYIISLQLAHFNHTALLVVGVTQDVEAVIGRDVLNTLIVTLNGAASMVEISD